MGSIAVEAGKTAAGCSVQRNDLRVFLQRICMPVIHRPRLPYLTPTNRTSTRYCNERVRRIGFRCIRHTFMRRADLSFGFGSVRASCARQTHLRAHSSGQGPSAPMREVLPSRIRRADFRAPCDDTPLQGCAHFRAFLGGLHPADSSHANLFSMLRRQRATAMGP